jgi:hypothetical protein
MHGIVIQVLGFGAIATLRLMKKLLAIIVLGLLWSNIVHAINEPFSLWCKSYKSVSAEYDKTTTESVSSNYEIYLTNDEAFIVGLESLYRNLIRQKNTNNNKYYFSNIGYNGRKLLDDNGRVLPFSGLLIDRINGEVILTDYIVNTTMIHMKCTKEKPKLLF